MSAHRRHMKLRGLSRRARQRIVTVKVYPHARVTHDGRRVQVQLLTEGGTHRVEQSATHDGLGRQTGLYKTEIVKKHLQEPTHE